MKLLRRVLYYHAAIWFVCGISIATAPSWILRTLFDQVPYPDYTYVRVCGAMSVGLALVMVLVAQKIEAVWWWSWAFAVTDAGIVTITALHAVVGPPDGSRSVLWWVFAGVNLVLGGGLLRGMAEAGREKPFV
jgi:hypothetical protein